VGERDYSGESVHILLAGQSVSAHGELACANPSPEDGKPWFPRCSKTAPFSLGCCGEVFYTSPVDILLQCTNAWTSTGVSLSSAMCR